MTEAALGISTRGFSSLRRRIHLVVARLGHPDPSITPRARTKGSATWHKDYGAQTDPYGRFRNIVGKSLPVIGSHLRKR
jgi:hypothetical protein